MEDSGRATGPRQGGAEERPGLRCRGCGSTRLRRSLPANPLEALARALTPLRFHRCAECGRRGHHFRWSVPPATRPAAVTQPVPVGRRRERRDVLAIRARRRSVVLSVLFATALGVLAALSVWLNSSGVSGE